MKAIERTGMGGNSAVVEQDAGRLLRKPYRFVVLTDEQPGRNTDQEGNRSTGARLGQIRAIKGCGRWRMPASEALVFEWSPIEGMEPAVLEEGTP